MLTAFLRTMAEDEHMNFSIRILITTACAIILSTQVIFSRQAHEPGNAVDSADPNAQPCLLAHDIGNVVMTLSNRGALGAEGVGSLAPGAPGDVTIIDPDQAWKVDAREFYSKGRNCPFDGLVLQGKAVITMVEGRIVARDGKIVAD